MYDSNEAESWDIDVTLVEAAGPRYILTYSADTEWLATPERVYPVIIDPVVTLTEKNAQIEDTFVSQVNPTRNYSDWEYLKSGNTSGQKRRTLIQFPNLLESLNLTAADEIVSSILVLYQSWDLQVDGGYSQPVVTDVFQVLKEWNQSTVTWNNHPNNDGGQEDGYRERVYDYEIIFNQDLRFFDVTSIVKNWQDGESNFGFLLKNHNDQGPVFDFNSSRHPNETTRPRLVITYRNQSGMEGYLSYTSAGLGRSGEAHVNNYNGNLVYTHTDISLPGNRLPLHISHVYNSDVKDVNIGFGNGWQLNLSQSVREETLIGAGINGEDIDYAVYTDGDGTIHWFEYKEDKYTSPPGLYLTLEKVTSDPETSFTISDNDDNKLKFDPQGRLYQIENNQGNITVITFSDGRISTVTDGSGRIATLSYVDGMLSKITDPSNREITYSYVGTDLSKITYPDALETEINYHSNGLLKDVTHPAQQKLVFTYLANGNVENLTYQGSDGSVGQSLSFAYDRNTTAVTDMAGRVTRYNFNHAGNPVNIIDPLDNAAHLRWEYNNLTRQMAPKNTTVNYLWNHRFDLDSEWQLVSEASSQATGSYVAAEVHPEARSYQIVKTNTLGQSFIKQDADLTPGDYTFSAYVKTSAITDGSGGAYIFVRDSAGNPLAKSAYVTGSQDWQRLYLIFQLDTADTISVGLGVEGAEGTAWFDSAQLESGLAATSYNLVENSVFARVNSTNPSLPWRWYMDEIQNLEAGDGLSSSTEKFGEQSFKFVGNAQIHKNLVQKINLSGKAGDPYIISGWAKARAVPRVPENDDDREYRTGALAIGFLNTHSGNFSWKYLDINEDYEGWQFLSGVIEAPYDYDQVYVYLAYHNNANEIYYDGIQLFQEPVTSYTYDDFGNIVSVNDPNNNSSNFIFDGNQNMVGMVDPQGGNYNYAYDSRHNVLSAVSPTGVGFGFSYDDHGNLVSASHGQLNNVNLLQNGSFQAGLRNWQQEQADNTGFLFTENDPASASNPVLGLFTNPVNSDSQLLGAWQEVSVKPNTEYTLSSKVYTQLQDDDVWLEVEELDEGGNVLDTTSDRFTALPRFSWTPRSVTFTTGSNTTKVRVHLKTGKGDAQAEAPAEAPVEQTDPVIYQTHGITPLKDAGANSGSPTNNYGASNWVGAGQTVSNQYRSAMGFDLPPEVMGRKIIEAKLYLYDRYVTWAADTESTIEIWDAISDWEEGVLTWNTFPTANKPAALSWTVPGQTAASDGTERTLDITEIVQRWADEYSSHINGIIMEPASFSSGTYKSFYSKEHTNPDYHPRLVITYEDWSTIPDISFNPSWLDGAVNVGLEIKFPYEEYRYLWSDSPDQPTSGWSAWLNTTSPVDPYSDTSPKFLHVEARDSAGNTTWRVSRPYTGDNPYGDKIVWFDDVQLEEGSRVSAFNMLANSNFNTIKSGRPEGYMFSTSSIAMDAVVSEDHRQGQNSIKVTSSGGEAFLFPYQQVILEPNTDYTISFWIKGEGLAKTGDSFSLAQGENGGPAPLFTYTTEEDEFDWRQIILPFTTGAELSPLNLKLGIMDGKGTVWIDDLALKKGNSLVTATYTTDGNYLQSITDAAGITTATYNYTQEGLKTGELDSVTDASGNSQSYTYDDLSRVTGVTAIIDPDNRGLDVSQSYGYNSADNLERISREYFDYVFTYDALGRMTNVKTDKDDGTQTTLVTHAYDETTGTLNSSTFGNGQVLEYAYDALDRLQGVNYNYSTRYSYSYDARGNIVRVEDNVNDITTWYSYDLSDRLLSFREEAKDQSSSRYVSYEYDKNNNATGLREVIDGVAYRTSFQYNEDNTIKSITINSGANFQYFHDEKGLPSRVVSTLNPNMVQNPTFASGLDSWVNVRGMSIEDGGLFGNNAARGIGYSMLRQYHSGLEEGIYTLSAHVKVVNNPVGAGEFTARIYDAENNILAISEKIFDTAGEWVRITATMDSPGIPAYIAILAGSTSSLYTGEEEVLWDGIKLEEGGTATQFENNQLYTNYDYNERGLLSSLQHSLESYTYEFDQLGNITKITAGNGNEASYTYDSLNQLTTETITEDGITRTISYDYDSHGNMITRTEGNKETVYTYDLDRLIQIEEKVDGVTVSTQILNYDGAGNLLNDGEYSYTWEMGRQLKVIAGTDLTTSYKYNENGLRTEKTVNGQTHEYTLLGSSVTREVIRDAAGEIIWTIHYSYAGDSTPVSMNVNGTEYYYLKNAQGDITHIVDGDGNEVASYEYDAWGNHLSVTGGEIAELNPYRYRGYRFDSETGLYYLQSRYYNPETQRFINSDPILRANHTVGINLNVYCDNDPVNLIDSDGYHPVMGFHHEYVIGWLISNPASPLRGAIPNVTIPGAGRSGLPGSRGYADLIHVSGVYEVKPAGKRWIRDARNKLDRYTGDDKYIGNEVFSLTASNGGYNYLIESYGDGIIFYSCTPANPDKQKELESFRTKESIYDLALLFAVGDVVGKAVALPTGPVGGLGGGIVPAPGGSAFGLMFQIR